MKRGLVAAANGAAPVYAQRLDRLRARLHNAGVDVGLVYGDVYRSDDIAHLTNLCIYWNEGTIAVPVDGPPAFLAKLSARVHTWMRRTSVLEDLRASQKLPELIATYLADAGARTVAFVDRRWWPSELVDGIAAAVSDVRFLDLPDAVRASRLAPDDHDGEDLARASAIVAAALAAAADGDGGVAARVAAIERVARDAGARDVLAVCRTLQSGGDAIEMTVQYANVWSSAARVLPAPGEPLAAAFAAARDALASGVTAAEVARAAPTATTMITHHCDLGTAGDYRPPADGAQPLPDAAVVRLAVTAPDAGTLADTFRLDAAGAVSLTAATSEVGA